jgi:hypothetical protein
LKRTTVFTLITAVLFTLVFSGCVTTTGPSTTSTSSTPATLPPDQEPVSIVSVTGPIPPFNPGGPVVEVTLKNVSAEPVVSLTAGLGINRAGPPGFLDFTFAFKVTPDNPLLPGATAILRQTLIGGGFADNVSYPLTINGTLKSGAAFTYTKQVLITPPAH